MAYSIIKVALAALIAIACIVALVIDSTGNESWAVPVLSLVVGYVIGNAAVTGNTPIAYRESVVAIQEQD